ncbi:MAG: hypothetical protein AAF351_11680 [Pseudomonadota bacterium]
MRPLTVINGIILGSCFAIAVSLAAVLIVFLILGTDYPRVQYEFKPLSQSLAIFGVMTAISGWSFYSLLKSRPERLWSQLALVAGLTATVFYYLP